MGDLFTIVVALTFYMVVTILCVIGLAMYMEKKVKRDTAKALQAGMLELPSGENNPKTNEAIMAGFQEIKEIKKQQEQQLEQLNLIKETLNINNNFIKNNMLLKNELNVHKTNIKPKDTIIRKEVKIEEPKVEELEVEEPIKDDIISVETENDMLLEIEEPESIIRSSDDFNYRIKDIDGEEQIKVQEPLRELIPRHDLRERANKLKEQELNEIEDLSDNIIETDASKNDNNILNEIENVDISKIIGDIEEDTEIINVDRIAKTNDDKKSNITVNLISDDELDNIAMLSEEERKANIIDQQNKDIVIENIEKINNKEKKSNSQNTQSSNILEEKVKEAKQLLKNKENKKVNKLINNNDLEILIVDDARFMRTILKKILLEEGYKNILEAESGAKAIEISKKNKNISIMIIDVEMPNMDGITTMNEILKDSNDVKIIMSSSIVEKNKVNKYIDLGAKGFIGKPFDKNNIVNVLNEILQD